MRPPICDVCHENFSLRDGDTVRFANYTPLPDGVVGHPKGLDWFCGRHIEAARALSHLTSGEAVRQIRAAETSSASPS